MINKLIIFSLGLCFSFSTFAQEPEKIMGYSVEPTGITFQVSSGGCTEKEDFSFSTKKEGIAVQILLVRDQVDSCEAYFPYGKKVSFTWDEMGLKSNDLGVVVNENTVLFVR